MKDLKKVNSVEFERKFQTQPKQQKFQECHGLEDGQFSLIDAVMNKITESSNSKATFIPDKFQEDAISHVANNNSVFVAAPTSAGETLIAKFAIYDQQNGKIAFITAPTKEL
uniref:Uncharacterized protein n=1 Tax=Panagrolaimus sp. PS1159 TaxID=55785 RepID=A0AC35FZS8_9BILA